MKLLYKNTYLVAFTFGLCLFTTSINAHNIASPLDINHMGSQVCNHHNLTESREGEFLIDTSIIHCHERNPNVAFDGTNYFVVWEDDRQGDWAIYGARISQTGIVLDTLGILISIETGIDWNFNWFFYGDQIAPSVAFDGTNYLVVWQDTRLGTWDICGTRVNQAGVVIDTLIVISQDFTGYCKDQIAPSIAFDGVNYLVVWQEYYNVYDFWYINGARVSQSGGVLDHIQISLENFDQYSPVVAFDGTNYLVVWDNGDIYGKRVTQSGAVLDSVNIPISIRGYYQEYSSIAFDGTNYLVVWQEIHNTVNYDIYGTRVQPSGIVIDTNAIPMTNSVYRENSPSIAFDGTNYFVSWVRDSINEVDVYGVRVNQTGIILDSTQIRITPTISNQYLPSIIFGDSDYLCVWEEIDSDSSYGIFGSRVDTSGSVIDTTGISISPLTTVYAQNHSSIAFDGTNYFVTWMDFRNHDWDIYGARLNNYGNVLESSSIVITTESGRQKNPCVAFDGTNYFVAWDKPTRGTRVNQSGIVLDTNGIIIHGGDRPAIAFDGTNYLVAVQRWRWWDDYWWPDIAGLLMDQTGIVINSFHITQGNQDDMYCHPAVVFDGLNYFVVYEEWQGGIIRGKRVSQSGTVLDSQGVVISFACPPRNPAVAFDGTNYFVVWYFGQPPGGDIYGAIVDTAATLIDTFTISTAPNAQGYPQIAIADTNYYVVWHENQDGDWNICGAKLSMYGTVIDYFIVSQQPGDQVFPALTHGLGNQFLITYSGWTDSINGHPAHALRIWGIFSEDLGIEETIETKKHTTNFDLQIYPNLLKKECNIKYTLSQKTKVTLSMYDITGRLVKEIVDECQNSGIYNIKFSESDLPQGVYFIRLCGEGFADTKKIILVK
jgi:hypothetical protein